MLSLLDGGKRLAELAADIKTRETSILHVLKDLEALNLTTKSTGAYTLTPLGIMEAQICSEYSSAEDVIRKFEVFWLTHDVKGIPRYLLTKIGALKDSMLIQTETSELSKVHETFLEILRNSERIKGISPIFHPDYVSVIEQKLSQGNTVELILTSDVLNKVLASASKARAMDELKRDFEEGRLKIFLKEDLGVALTVTEKSFSLGLFKVEGEYDYSMDLVSLSRQAIDWGEELFRDYCKGAGRYG
jgi:predicted transcriptional regulator